MDAAVEYVLLEENPGQYVAVQDNSQLQMSFQTYNVSDSGILYEEQFCADNRNSRRLESTDNNTRMYSENDVASSNTQQNINYEIIDTEQELSETDTKPLINTNVTSNDLYEMESINNEINVNSNEMHSNANVNSKRNLNTTSSDLFEIGTMNNGIQMNTNGMRTSPTTVKWLLDNYEIAEGISLPRSTIYTHYLNFCAGTKQDPVNAASFGKLIRFVFHGIKTRRLGTRGNSKYHYYGIRVKPGSSLSSVNRNFQTNKFVNTAAINMKNYCSGRTKKPNETITEFRDFLGEGRDIIPEFPGIHFMSSLPDNIQIEDVDLLRIMYYRHCETVVDAIMSLDFPTLETIWRNFWRSTDAEYMGDMCLPKPKLMGLCTLEPVQSFIYNVDTMLYQNLLKALLPDVLRQIPNELVKIIRASAKNMEPWLCSAIIGCPSKISEIKLKTVYTFSQTLRRYTSLNHLAQTSRAVLNNNNQIAQLLCDFNRIDFDKYHRELSWVCQFDFNLIELFKENYQRTLEGQNTLEQWTSLLKNIVVRALKPHEGKSTYLSTSRELLLKWSYNSSITLRELTLNSAVSFGSFQLIRLFLDEYMYYLIEQEVFKLEYIKANENKAPSGFSSEDIEADIKSLIHDSGISITVNSSENIKDSYIATDVNSSTVNYTISRQYPSST